jgi:hypothetical protein
LAASAEVEAFNRVTDARELDIPGAHVVAVDVDVLGAEHTGVQPVTGGGASWDRGHMRFSPTASDGRCHAGTHRIWLFETRDGVPWISVQPAAAGALDEVIGHAQPLIDSLAFD